MKSIVLLVVVALCAADIVKDGGLKGSWDDAFALTSDFDNTAPGIDYDGTTALWYYYTETPINLTDWNTGSADYNRLYFTITGEDEDSFYTNSGGLLMTSGVEVTMVDGDFESAGACSLSYDLSVDCTFYVYAHSGQHSYTPVITAWDAQGNWATYSVDAEGDFALSAVFDDATRPYTWMVYDHAPDFTAPTIISGTMNGAAVDVDVVLGASTSLYNFEYVTLEVVVNDHEDESADDYDMYASSIRGVWAVIADTDDLDTEWSEALLYDTYDINTEYQTWAVQFAWANWAPTGSWIVQRFTAVDRAGNWATEKALASTITVSFDNDDEVTSCQTLILNELASDFDTTDGDDAVISFTAGCVAKYTGNNYGYLSFASPEYLMGTDTVKSSVIVSSEGYYGYGYDATYMQTEIDVDSSATSYAPGTSFSGTVGFSTYVYIGTGAADETVGDWTLYELITFTETGAVQRYTFELGAASSVVPSAIAVVIAAIFAMLRL